jgi:3-oxoacyl-[acyl-carrier protein] reductase
MHPKHDAGTERALSGKVALVTGGGTGLGAAVARRLAQAGASVVVHYSRSEREARRTVDELRALGARAELAIAELNGDGVVAEVARMIEQVAGAFGRLDLVINNAAATRAVEFSRLEQLTADDWDLVLNVNTKAPFFVAQAAAPLLRESRGQIINTASISGLRAKGGSSIAYSVSKAATIHLTKCLATALAPEVRVNAVAPGVMPTRWLAHFDEAQIASTVEQAPLKRLTDVEDAAQAFLMLAQNPSITGQVIVVDAGISV